jgi:taurine transport system substrate-binding protein
MGLALSIALPLTLSSHAFSADKPNTVRLGYFAGPRPWIIGKAQKLFEQEMGAQVEWFQFGSGANALSALAAGQIDISRLGSTPTVASIARGLPVDMIAIEGIIARSERLIAKQGVGSVADLKGKSVAYPPGSTAHYGLMAAIKSANLQESELTLLSLQPSEMLAAWERGDIDAAYVWGPFTNQMEASGGTEILATVDLQQHGYFVWNDYVVRREFAAQYPETVTSFLRAFGKTVEMYKADPAGMAAVVATELDLPTDVVAQTMAGLSYPSFEEQLSPALMGEGGPILDIMKDQANFLAELGDLSRREIPDSFASNVNLTYMREAAKR